jgi:hypothetical protein
MGDTIKVRGMGGGFLPDPLYGAGTSTGPTVTVMEGATPRYDEAAASAADAGAGIGMGTILAPEEEVELAYGSGGAMYALISYGYNFDAYGFYVDLDYTWYTDSDSWFASWSSWYSDGVGIVQESTEAMSSVAYDGDPNPTVDYYYTVDNHPFANITTLTSEDTTSATYMYIYTTGEHSALKNRFGSGDIEDFEDEVFGYLSENYTNIASQVYASYISKRQLLKRVPALKIDLKSFSFTSSLRSSDISGSVSLAGAARLNTGY